MSLVDVLLYVVSVVLLLHLLGILGLIRFSGMRFRRALIAANLRMAWPTAVVLGVVLAANGAVRDIGVELSWIVGVNVTGAIHAIEGDFVAVVQSFATPTLTAYFSFVYVFGYVFLLTFPVVIYTVHDDPRALLATLVAYALNYGVGFLCYVVFVAYGPRNYMPGAVESLLFTHWPEVQFLTSRVNENTNVFPSLHTSLSVTVALLAAHYRSASREWLPVASVGALSIAIATMYLGIHWLTDVIAGIALAAGSVAAGARVADREYDDPGNGRLRRAVRGVFERVRQ